MNSRADQGDAGPVRLSAPNGWASFPDFLREIHQLFKSILLLTYDRCDLHLQERLMHDKRLHRLFSIIRTRKI